MLTLLKKYCVFVLFVNCLTFVSKKIVKTKYAGSITVPWRTLVYQEVILRIGSLGKLGCFESTAEIFYV
jgi:hypothetical protein